MANNKQRLDFLDAVRAFALLVGILFHSALSFITIFIGWVVMDIDTSEWITTFVLISHSFKMPLFFLIAGFFSHLALQRKGRIDFVKTRLVRIAVPFILGWIFLHPLIVSGWTMGAQSVQGEVDIRAGLEAGINSLTTLSNGFLVGTHLWFLYYLLLITFLLLFVDTLLNIQPRLKSILFVKVKAMIGWVSQSHYGLFILATLTTICLWYMQNWGLDTPDKSLVPHIPTFLVYTGMFTVGWLLHCSGDKMRQLGKVTGIKIVVGFFAIACSLLLSPFQMNPNHPSF